MIRPLRRAHARLTAAWWLLPLVIGVAMWTRSRS